jgi:hypothetical protein
MKAQLFKILHYTLFIAFVAFCAITWFVPITTKLAASVLGALFLAHTFIHGQSVATDIHAEYDEFRQTAQALKDKFITAFHTFVQSVEVNPQVAASLPAAHAGVAEAEKLVKDVAAAVKNEAPVAQPVPATEPTPIPAATPVAEPAPAPASV